MVSFRWFFSNFFVDFFARPAMLPWSFALPQRHKSKDALQSLQNSQKYFDDRKLRFSGAPRLSCGSRGLPHLASLFTPSEDPRYPRGQVIIHSTAMPDRHPFSPVQRRLNHSLLFLPENGSMLARDYGAGSGDSPTVLLRLSSICTSSPCPPPRSLSSYLHQRITIPSSQRLLRYPEPPPFFLF